MWFTIKISLGLSKVAIVVWIAYIVLAAACVVPSLRLAVFASYHIATNEATIHVIFA